MAILVVSNKFKFILKIFYHHLNKRYILTHFIEYLNAILKCQSLQYHYAIKCVNWAQVWWCWIRYLGPKFIHYKWLFNVCLPAYVGYITVCHIKYNIICMVTSQVLNYNHCIFRAFVKVSIHKMSILMQICGWTKHKIT